MNTFKSKFDEHLFKFWINLSFLIVISIILIGGLTRLTESGLSITEWELFSGILPPLNLNEWNEYFDKYKTIPQFQLLNSNMNLEEFKIIFLWEYAHRMLARFLGLFFLIFFIYFKVTKQLSRTSSNYLSLIFLLIIVQGIIGWLMVKSGLNNSVTVSHYRLALHLLSAFIITTLIFWFILNINNKTNINLFKSYSNHSEFRLLILILFTQIILGAFVSGLDGGKIYQTWPSMNGYFFPDDLSLNNINLDQPSFVQFLHRTFAYLIMMLTFYVGYKIFIKKKKKLYYNYFSFLFLITAQVTFGILVLFTNVNIYMASTHQILGIFLILTSIRMYYYSLKDY